MCYASHIHTHTLSLCLCRLSFISWPSPPTVQFLIVGRKAAFHKTGREKEKKGKNPANSQDRFSVDRFQSECGSCSGTIEKAYFLA